MKRVVIVTMAALALTGIGSCAGSSPSEPTPPPPPTATNVITITSAGANPRNVVIDAGTRVRFINNDSRAHNMSSDPHPEHTDCNEINQVGLLTAGQTRETGNLNTARTCGFHDHDLPNNTNLLGTIVIR